VVAAERNITIAMTVLGHHRQSTQKLGPISKHGDRYLRRLYVSGAMALLRVARTNPAKHPWLTQLLARKPAKVAAVALANKMARIAWALLARGETYHSSPSSGLRAASQAVAS
jgi:transposase